jgi:hypothetical protein
LTRLRPQSSACAWSGRGLDLDEARSLYDETEGQPLFVIETVRAGLAGTAQASHVKPGPSCTGDTASASSVRRLPPRVQAVIAARLAQLSGSARQTVSLAATIGRSFTLDLLVAASEDDVDSLVGALDELWQRRIVREHGTSAYDFSRDKIREVAYTELSATRRLMLHRRVARALERVYAANLDAVSAQVATHYEQGGLPTEAVPYFQRAAGLCAGHLRQRGSYPPVEQGPGAARFAATHPGAARARAGAANGTRNVAGGHRRIRRFEDPAHLQTLSRTWPTPGETSKGERWYEAELLRCRGELLLSRDHAVEAETAFQRALGIARYQAAKAMELRVATSLARLWQRQARYADGRQLLEQTCAWFDDDLATSDLIDARSVLAVCRELSA